MQDDTEFDGMKQEFSTRTDEPGFAIAYALMCVAEVQRDLAIAVDDLGFGRRSSPEKMEPPSASRN